MTRDEFKKQIAEIGHEEELLAVEKAEAKRKFRYPFWGAICTGAAVIAIVAAVTLAVALNTGIHSMKGPSDSPVLVTDPTKSPESGSQEPFFTPTPEPGGNTSDVSESITPLPVVTPEPTEPSFETGAPASTEDPEETNTPQETPSEGFECNISLVDIHSFLKPKEERTPSPAVSEITEGMTLGELLDMNGSPVIDDRNTDYPIFCSWDLGGDRLLTVVFLTDDRDAFWQKIVNGEFILPDETVQYGSYGLRNLTANELSEIQKWIRNFRAVAAYTTENGEKTVLFE